MSRNLFCFLPCLLDFTVTSETGPGSLKRHLTSSGRCCLSSLPLVVHSLHEPSGGGRWGCKPKPQFLPYRSPQGSARLATARHECHCSPSQVHSGPHNHQDGTFISLICAALPCYCGLPTTSSFPVLKLLPATTPSRFPSSDHLKNPGLTISASPGPASI